MRTFLTFTFLIAFAASAHAQNKIIVIDEQGGVSEIDIGPSPVAPAPKEKSATPPLPEAQAPVVAADPAPEPARAPAVKPAKKPAPQKQAVKKETVKKSAAPKKKKAVPSGEPAQASREAPASAPEPEYVSPRAQRRGPYMTPEDAIRIALDVAPPAISVTASPVNYKGLHAYEVVFKTEGGDQHVYVDRETGKLVK